MIARSELTKVCPTPSSSPVASSYPAKVAPRSSPTAATWFESASPGLLGQFAISTEFPNRTAK
ncbi:hypothetical protein TIFTF001_030231 [Ficus carica]|uniref:Uncharacterized protein n=1 Tax=Ficus carica TaxID=3494 RepID=A0AA88J2I7_FICCA|nr:hypothetical protein TIFTF001_030231 [Ficus carica]